MQVCDYRNICNAHPQGRHFQSCFGICNAVNRISRWICDAAALPNLHYTTDCNLSCVAPKTSGLVLLSSQLDYGVGTFLNMISGWLDAAGKKKKSKSSMNDTLGSTSQKRHQAKRIKILHLQQKMHGSTKEKNQKAIQDAYQMKFPPNRVTLPKLI